MYSVPTFKDLPEETLSRIADVCEEVRAIQVHLTPRDGLDSLAMIVTPASPITARVDPLQ